MKRNPESHNKLTTDTPDLGQFHRSIVTITPNKKES